jgi:hypothetical protein
VPVDPDLVDVYWRQHRLSSGDRADRLAADEHFWAWEAVHDAVDELHPDVVELITALADAAATDLERAYLGAGPVENLLRHPQVSDRILDQLDGAARRHPGVQIAVRCVWFGDETRPDIVERFRRFGPPL